jgi:hypothetical protein
MKAPQKIGMLLSIGLMVFVCASSASGEGAALSWETYRPQKDPAYRPAIERTVNWELILKATQDFERLSSRESRQGSQLRAENQSDRYLNDSSESRPYPSPDLGFDGYLNYYGFYGGRYDPWLYSYQPYSPRLFWWSLIPLMNLDNFKNHSSKHRN